MRKDLIPNPPSPEKAKEIARTATKGSSLKLTPAVREAVKASFANGNYSEFCRYVADGAVTGSITGDLYFLAERLVEWEAADNRHGLAGAIANKEIRLVDIVKRLSPVLKELVDYERGVITGEKQPQG